MTTTTPARMLSVLRSDEMADLFETCVADPPSKGARDAGMLAVFYGCGLRRRDLARLDLDDFDAIRILSEPPDRLGGITCWWNDQRRAWTKWFESRKRGASTPKHDTAIPHA